MLPRLECILKVPFIVSTSIQFSVFSRSAMKASTFFSLFLALATTECLDGIIIKTKKLDEDVIIKAAVSSLLLNFCSCIFLIQVLVQKIVKFYCFFRCSSLFLQKLKFSDFKILQIYI